MKITPREETLLNSAIGKVERLQNSVTDPDVKNSLRDAKDALLRALVKAS